VWSTPQLLVQVASGLPGVRGVPAQPRAAEESRLALVLAEEGPAAADNPLSLERATPSRAPVPTPAATELSTKTSASVGAVPQTEEAELFSAQTHLMIAMNIAQISVMPTVIAQGTCWQQTPKSVNCFTTLYAIPSAADGKVLPLA